MSTASTATPSPNCDSLLQEGMLRVFHPVLLAVLQDVLDQHNLFVRARAPHLLLRVLSVRTT